MALSASTAILAGATLMALTLPYAPLQHAVAGVPLQAVQSGRQDRQDDGRQLRRMIMPGSGAFIGATIDDVSAADAERLKVRGGALVQDVAPDGPAAKAGLRKGDLIVEFDGERVRSARQLSRLVQESTPERTVNVKVMREGRTTDVSLAPEPRRPPDLVPGDLRDRLGDLRNLPFEFDDLMPGVFGPQLGVSVQELTPQLAAYFGAREGLLVASVSENSAAARAGLKAGDVITSVNGGSVGTRADLVAALRRAGPTAQVTLAIVRDKKESSVTAQLPDDRARRPLRSNRPI